MGWEEMADDLGTSVRSLRTIVSRFEGRSELTRKPTSRGTIVRVVRYDFYVDDRLKDDKQKDKQTTSRRQADDNSKETEASKDSKDTTTGSKVEPCPVNTPAPSVGVVERDKDGRPKATPPAPTSGIVSGLIAFGVDPGTAYKLTEGHEELNIRRVLDYARAEGKGPGFVVKALREGWTLPDDKNSDNGKADPPSPGTCRHCGKQNWRATAKRTGKDGCLILTCDCGHGVKATWATKE